MVPPPPSAMGISKFDIDVREVRKIGEVNIIHPHIGIPPVAGAA